MLETLWITIQNNAKFDAVQQCVSDIISEGYPIADLLLRLHEDILVRPFMSDFDKALIFEKLAQVINTYTITISS